VTITAATAAEKTPAEQTFIFEGEGSISIAR
jgi:hypothetical protein